MTAYPNVPPGPGVPVLARLPGQVFATAGLLTADAVAVLGLGGSPQWGLFQNGLPVVIADNVVSLDYKQEWSIASCPIEDGGFQSYDKVPLPFDGRVRFSTGGSNSDREALLTSIASIAGSLSLYDLVMPEQVYTSVNVGHYDLHREAINGAGLIKIDVSVVQIRIASAGAFTNTAAPSGAAPTNGGTVQPQTPSQSALSSIVGSFY